MSFTSLSAGFQSLSPLPTSKSGPSDVYSQVGGFVYILGPIWSLQCTLLWVWEFFLLPQPPQDFTVRGFEGWFPCTGNLGCTVGLTPQFFLPVYPHASVGLPGPPDAVSPAQVLWPPPCHMSSLPDLPISAPPTSLDERFFNSFAVGPTVRFPGSSDFFCF